MGLVDIAGMVDFFEMGGICGVLGCILEALGLIFEDFLVPWGG